MGKTSSAVKNRYNRKTYDQVNVRLKKGSLDALHLLALQRGCSLAEYIRQLAAQDALQRGCKEAYDTLTPPPLRELQELFRGFYGACELEEDEPLEEHEGYFAEVAKKPV